MTRLTVLREWSTVADAALRELPEHSEWPSALYRDLTVLAAGEERRVVIATVVGRAAALMAFQRPQAGTWAPVTQWVVPGFLGLGDPAMLEAILERLPFKAKIAWWRVHSALPAVRGRICDVETEPTFGSVLHDDFEAYWKSTDCARTIRRAERRSGDLQFQVNAAGAPEWVIRNCERKWRPKADGELPRTQHRLLAARQLGPLGKFLSFTLSDGDAFVAGQNVFVHGGELVCVDTFRDPRYDNRAVGNTLLARVYRWGREHGYAAIDIGGGFSYKTDWSPQRGTKSYVYVAPLLDRVRARYQSQIVGRCKAIARRARSLMRARQDVV